MPMPSLARGEDDLLARDGQDVLELLDDRLGVGRWQVDLVEDGDDGQVLARSARWTLASVWASMPWVASTTRIAPSQAAGSG